MDINELLPKDKFDYNSVEKLEVCDKELLRPVIPELLIWLQDINWPIALGISNVLIQFDKELVPFIKGILNSDDAMWKYWILAKLVEKMTPSAKSELKEDLNRLSYNPDINDLDAGVDELAQELLQRMELD
jgi:hypothetical protein